MTKRARILSFLGVLLAICVLYLWFFGFTTGLACEARYIGWKTPEVYAIPTSLSDLGVSQAPGLKLTYFGYEFEAPWSDLDEGRTKQIGRMRVIAFRSGRSILFSTSAPKEFVSSFASTFGNRLENVTNLYGPDSVQSDYSLHSLILDATPRNVGIFSPRKEAVGTAMLLVVKGVMMPRGGESGIFRIGSSNFQGFQFGDPSTRPKSLTVQLYSEEGGVGFVFSQQQTGPPITQAEINRVIQSVHRVQAESGAGGGG